MNAKTREALEGSIKKWNRIVRSTKALDKGADNCPLCALPGYCCNGCPVQTRTGGFGCSGSPFDAWREHHNRVHENSGDSHRIPGCKECLRLAKAERDFLVGLRDK